MVVIFAEVHPFGSVTAEPIAVDIVSPQEVPPPAKQEVPPPVPPKAPDSFDFSSKSEPSSPPAPTAPPQAATPPLPKQAAPSPPRPNRQQAAAQPQPQPQPSSAPALPTGQAAAQPQPPATAAASSAFTPPQPDLSLKYHVMLGLPLDKPGDGFDAPASTAANLESSLVTDFRRHLKACSKLPESVSPSDNIKIKLRVFMTTDGQLAREPLLIEASASAKGPALMQAAMSALQACQPYAMLPADRYQEWKMLDLSFTPQDFAGG